MSGRAHVYQLKSRLDSAFSRGATVPPESELGADIARYLSLLVAGYLERCVILLLRNYCETRIPSREIMKYVGTRLDRFQNPSRQRIIDLLSNFNEAWGKNAELFIVEERQAAIGSVMHLRNRIAHGDWTDVSYVRLTDYYKEVQLVVDFLTDLIEPTGAP